MPPAGISEQTLIREEMNTLVAEVKYDIAYAGLQNAFGNVYASMGLDPFGDEFDPWHGCEIAFKVVAGNLGAARRQREIMSPAALSDDQRNSSSPGSSGLSRSGAKADRSIVLVWPVVISSATASPVAGAFSMPQTEWPVAM